MPNRNFSVSSYRYGFNGKENDPETVGTAGGTQDYGFRIYNPSLGKFLSVDPLAGKYPFKTPYDFAENTPMWGTDLDGLELNINPSRYLLNAANKSSVGLEKVNTFAKITNNYQLQVEVGASKWLVNGLYFIAAMGGEQNPQVSTSTIPPCGGVAPYTKAQQKENLSYASYDDSDPLMMKGDMDKIVNGDISEKTVGTLNVAGKFAAVFGVPEENVVTPNPFSKVNIYGEGEMPFVDVAVNPRFQNDRMMSSTIPSGSVSEIYIRNSPLKPQELSEISRMSRSGTKITYKGPVEGGFFKDLEVHLGDKATLKSTKTFYRIVWWL